MPRDYHGPHPFPLDTRVDPDPGVNTRLQVGKKATLAVVTVAQTWMSLITGSTPDTTPHTRRVVDDSEEQASQLVSRCSLASRK